MRKSKKFIGMPVISLAEGQQMGTVKGLVVDPVQQKVAALIIEQKGWFSEQKFVPYGKVRSVGADAITIDQGAVVEKGTGLPDILKLFKDKVAIIGCKIIMENGSNLGEVDEYFVEETTGSIVGLEVIGNLLNSIIKGKSYLDIGFVNTIGKQLVVVSNDAMVNTVKIDGGLQETVKQIKDSTSHIWESTLQKTKELGSKTKELSSKTKEELENKTKDLTGITMGLGESLLEKVRGKDKSDEAAADPAARSADPIEDVVEVKDLPPEASVKEEEKLTRAAQPIEDQVAVADLPPEAFAVEEKEATRSAEPVEDQVEVADLPPEAFDRAEGAVQESLGPEIQKDDDSVAQEFVDGEVQKPVVENEEPPKENNKQ
ncbi:MAG: PRC-barrel domain-containing protein [Bacillota bacterium]|nr:PRC-barrel domain-containing protein [Bacillota bacterium]